MSLSSKVNVQACRNAHTALTALLDHCNGWSTNTNDQQWLTAVAEEVLLLSLCTISASWH